MAEMVNSFGLVLIPVFRNVAGWVIASLEDGKIQKYEINQLAVTMLRMAVLGVGLSGVAGLTTGQVDGLLVGAATILADKAYLLWKGQKKGKR